jgi:nucleoid DNA-binding protein
MNKAELIAARGKKQHDLTKKDVELSVDCILTQIEQPY